MNETGMTDIILNGIGVSSGIAIGKVFILEEDDFVLVEKPFTSVESETKRLQDAAEKTKKELLENQENLQKFLGDNYAEIANAHILMLEDPMLKGEVLNIVNTGKNAEYAVYHAVNKIAKAFDAIDNEYFRDRKQDVLEVGKKILGHLLGKTKKTLRDLDSEAIVVAKSLSPADTLLMRENMVKGFVTEVGGRTSHTALVAKSLEIPAVVGLKNIVSIVGQGAGIVIDGNKGVVILNPTQETLDNYQREYEIQVSSFRDLARFKDLPAITTDGKEILIAANIENPEEIKSVLKYGANGIGLYRSEFMYMGSKIMPTEEDHFINYSKIAKKMMPYEVIIRTVDLGGDKITKMGLMNIGREANPFMGLRAIRFCLKYREVFKTQLRGILRASVYGNIKIMYPMISRISEIKQANEILEECKNELRKEGKPFNADVKVGAMIEVPSAAVIADLIATEVDFMSIGTNDLIQYTMAVDRVNVDIAHLYDPMHPAILRLLKHIVDSAHMAGKEVGMCGEMAGDAKYTAVLLGLGLDELSMSSVQIPNVKKNIRSVSERASKQLVDDLLNCKSITETNVVMNRFKYR